MEHVAVATLVDPTNVALDDVQAVTPALPVTVKTTVPVGVTPPDPVTVAVKTMPLPTVVTPLSVTTLVGVTMATVSVLVAEVTEA
jgi:hypothetical protein